MGSKVTVRTYISVKNIFEGSCVSSGGRCGRVAIQSRYTMGVGAMIGRQLCVDARYTEEALTAHPRMEPVPEPHQSPLARHLRASRMLSYRQKMRNGTRGW